MRLLLFVSFIGLLVTFTLAQRKPVGARADADYVWMFDSKGRLMRMFPLLAPVAEHKNNRINLAVREESGRMLQINGLHPSLLRDTLIHNAAIQLVLMGKHAIYTATKATLRINTYRSTPGESFRVYGLARLHAKGVKPIRIEFQLNAIVPEPQFIKTDTHPQ